jgi:hypothetical protein
MLGCEDRHPRPSQEHLRTQSHPCRRIRHFPSRTLVHQPRGETLKQSSHSSYHLLNLTQGEPATHLRLDNRVGNEIETVEIGIKHIYGIKVLDEGSPSCPKSLGALARIGIFAEQYKIAGLLEAVFEATTCSLMDCLSDGGKLDLLFRCHVRSFHQSTKDAGAFFRFATKIFGDNIDKLYNMAVFQRLLVEIPRLALDILNYVAEKQSKVKDSK